VADPRQLLSDRLEPKSPRGDPGLNEHAHSGRDRRGITANWAAALEGKRPALRRRGGEGPSPTGIHPLTRGSFEGRRVSIYRLHTLVLRRFVDARLRVTLSKTCK